MHSQSTVAQALALRQEGLGARRIAKRLSLPVSTVAGWLAGNLPAHSRLGDPTAARRCAACGLVLHEPELLTASYVYLLGLYLGDGSISKHPRDVYKLRIFLDAKYPGIIASAREAIGEVKGGVAASCRRPQNCVEVYSFWKSWPCLFPQQGPGKKHARRIELTEWQTTLVEPLA